MLKYHYYYLTDRELLAIIRRIDTDGDARVSFSELSDFLQCEYPVSKPFDVEVEL